MLNATIYLSHHTNCNSEQHFTDACTVFNEQHNNNNKNAVTLRGCFSIPQHDAIAVPTIIHMQRGTMCLHTRVRFNTNRDSELEQEHNNISPQLQPCPFTSAFLHLTLSIKGSFVPMSLPFFNLRESLMWMNKREATDTILTIARCILTSPALATANKSNI